MINFDQIQVLSLRFWHALKNKLIIIMMVPKSYHESFWELRAQKVRNEGHLNPK